MVLVTKAILISAKEKKFSEARCLSQQFPIFRVQGLRNASA